MSTDFTVGTDGKRIDLSLSGQFLTLKEATRLRDQLNETLIAHVHAGPHGSLIRERDAILDVYERDRTEAQSKRLKQISDRLDRTHSVLTPVADREAMDIIRRAAKILKAQL